MVSPKVKKYEFTGSLGKIRKPTTKHLGEGIQVQEDEDYRNNGEGIDLAQDEEQYYVAVSSKMNHQKLQIFRMNFTTPSLNRYMYMNLNLTSEVRGLDWFST